MYAQRNCPFVYKVTAIEKVVDGDTVDVVIDLGFDVRVSQRVRLLGIDTPESRTRDLEEKQFGLLSKKKLKQWCLKAVESEKDDIELELRCEEADSRENLAEYSPRFGSPKMATPPMLTNGCATKDMQFRMLVRIRRTSRRSTSKTARRSDTSYDRTRRLSPRRVPPTRATRPPVIKIFYTSAPAPSIAHLVHRATLVVAR